MFLTFIGAIGTVTGSKTLVEAGHGRFLVDCGLFQGLKNLRELNWAPLPVPPSSIDAVVLTHAHLDHSGYLPRLVRDGFRGRIYATAATRDVAELILKDSGFLNEKDAEYANRKGLGEARADVQWLEDVTAKISPDDIRTYMQTEKKGDCQ